MDAIHDTIVQLIRQAGIAIYPYPVPDTARRFPSAMLVPVRREDRRATRDDAFATVREYEVWIAYPYEQRRSDRIWTITEEQEAKVAELLSEALADALWDAGIPAFVEVSGSGPRVIQRESAEGGPYAESRIRVVIRLLREATP